MKVGAMKIGSGNFIDLPNSVLSLSILRAGGNVFVMTPGMLHHMLVHAHIHMTDIKLLIFDECHHAGKLDE